MIAVHRMLKNDVDHDEYILFSESFLAETGFLGEGDGFFEDKDLGRVSYQYNTIDQWKKDINVPEEVPGEVKPDMLVESSEEIPFDVDTLQEFIMDFRYRHLWNKEADEIIFDENRINRVGEEHYCIIKGKHLFFDTIKPKVEPEQRSYGEILKNPSPLKYFETDFLMAPIDDHSTRLTLRMAISLKWWIQKPLIPLMRPRMAKKAKEVLLDIKAALTVHLQDQAVPARQTVNSNQ